MDVNRQDGTRIYLGGAALRRLEQALCGAGTALLVEAVQVAEWAEGERFALSVGSDPWLTLDLKPLGESGFVVQAVVIDHAATPWSRPKQLPKPRIHGKAQRRRDRRRNRARLRQVQAREQARVSAARRG